MPAITIVTDSGQSDEGYGFKPLSSTVMAGINAASLSGKNCTLVSCPFGWTRPFGQLSCPTSQVEVLKRPL